MREKRPLLRQLAWAAVISLAFIVFLGKSYENSIKAIDSSIHATLAMNVTSQGLWPAFPMGAEQHGGVWGRGFNDHPFLMFYLDGLIMRVFGPSAWTARLLPGLFSVGCVILTGILGTLLAGEIFGLLSAAILALTVDFFRNGSGFQLDTAMTFFILLSFIFWLKNRPLKSGVSVAFGAIAKAPVALLVYPVIAIRALIRKNVRKEFRFSVLALVATVVVLAIFWSIYGRLAGWEWVSDYWGRQVFGTAVYARHEGGKPDYFLFFSAARTRYWPWAILVVWGLIRAFKSKEILADFLLIPFLAAAIEIALISLMPFKSGSHYYVPAYPFLAMIAAYPIKDWIQKRETAFYFGLTLLSLTALTLLTCFPIELGPEAFPALRRFNAIIQSYGNCSDRVVFIDGGQPYGSASDYIGEVSFYTGRKLIAADCQSAEKLASAPDVGWILLTDETESCLKPDLIERFKTRFRFGNQILLTKLSVPSREIDLTPLERELKAVTDCKPAPYPHDRYHH